jgi:hypothetical protein
MPRTCPRAFRLIRRTHQRPVARAKLRHTLRPLEHLVGGPYIERYPARIHIYRMLAAASLPKTARQKDKDEEQAVPAKHVLEALPKKISLTARG